MKVLLGIDGSECSRAAGRLLAALPLPVETQITVLSAIPGSHWLDTPMLAYPAEEETSAARSAAEEAAEPLRARGFSVTVQVRCQNPTAAILDQAEEDEADLIVVGSHGKSAVRRFLLGSVSEGVARYAPCSVLVARGDALQKVIVAVDGSEASEHALDTLTRLPLPEAAKLIALHVLPRSEPSAPISLLPSEGYEKLVAEYEEERRCAAQGIVRHAQHRLSRTGHPVEPAVRSGITADEIVAAARAREADLIVVGTANRSALGRLFLGSVSARVLSHAPCSVLVARSVASANGG